MASRSDLLTKTAITGLVINCTLCFTVLGAAAKYAGAADIAFLAVLSAAMLFGTYLRLSYVIALPDSVWLDNLVFQRVIIVLTFAAVVCGGFQFLAIVAGPHGTTGSALGLFVQLVLTAAVRRKMSV